MRMDKFENEKELISIWKKKWRLMQGKRALNWVELPKPERWGYKRFFVLREDVAKSREANFYAGILKLIQNTVLSRDKKFEYKDYKTKTKKPIMQYVKDIDLREWNKLIAAGKLTDKQQSFFERKWKNNPGNRGGYWTFEFKKPWVFEMKRQPHYITHRILIDPKLESELTELSNRIERQNLTPKISKIMGWKYGWKDFYDRKKMIIENETDKLLKEELVGFTERYED
jgi:hypothetical protein